MSDLFIQVGRRDDDLSFMMIALEEARAAFEMGEVPVGAVLVRDGNVIARGHNLRETTKDPSAHAEILTLRQASASVGDSWRLSGAVLYVTKEPCIMCAGAIVNARIAKLVYGCKDPKAGGSTAFTGFRLTAGSTIA